jgi:hypothetical protein
MLIQPEKPISAASKGISVIKKACGDPHRYTQPRRSLESFSGFEMGL